ncbi:MAG: sugar phosphate isomerase/epimerase family protein [Phycisphaerales bacterium JB059]
MVPDASLDRRAFLARAAGAAACGVLAGGVRGAVEAPAPRARFRKALKFGMIGGGQSVREKFAMARDAGFEGVEMDSPGPLDLEEVLRAKEATGIETPGVVDSVHWNAPLSHPEEDVRRRGREGLETAIRDCRALGGTTVLLVPAVVNAGVSPADAWRRSMRELERVAPIASEAGVSVAIENVWNNFLLSPSAAARYVDEANGHTPAGADPVYAWYFDVGNIWRHGWPQHWIRELGERIARIDVKGYSRAKADKAGAWAGFGVEIGEGDLPWDEVNVALDEIRYGGWITAEVGGGGADRLRAISGQMDRVFARAAP